MSDYGLLSKVRTSRSITLARAGSLQFLPGDVISTGMPEAVEIRDGDVVSCRIVGFEELSNPVARRS